MKVYTCQVCNSPIVFNGVYDDGCPAYTCDECGESFVDCPDEDDDPNISPCDLYGHGWQYDPDGQYRCWRCGEEQF